MVDLTRITRSLVDMDAAGTEELVNKAIRENTPAREILEGGLIAGMQVIGERFERGEIFLPELLVSGGAMKSAMGLLRPLLIEQEGEERYAGRAAIGTVQGDVHDIGKNILIMLLEGNGWGVTDLGVDVSPEQFCAAVRNGGFQILGLSALLTTTMPNQKRTIQALEVAGLRNRVKVAVGGAVVSQRYADQIGADCYAADASEAVKQFKLLVS